MFCPVGYVPASVAAVDFDEWMRHLIQESIELGDPLGLQNSSKAEISHYCHNRFHSEFSFFLDDCESLSICGFDGALLKVDRGSLLERADFRWFVEWFPEELKLDELRHFYIDTNNYTVTVNHWYAIFSDIWKEFFSGDWDYMQRKVNILSRFDGWAICISENDDERIPSYIVERLRLPPTVLEGIASDTSTDGKRRGPGRPPLKKAKAAYAAMGFTQGNLSREQVARLLETRTGEKPSAKTMRDWEREAGIAPPGEN